MTRVATCKDCGARFKVPESTTATRAKCKTCGGVLEIPPAETAAAPAPAKATAGESAKAAPKKATAPKRAAPVKKTAPAKAAPARKAGASSKAAGRKAGGKSGGGARKGARKASGSKAARSGSSGGSGSDSKTGLMVGLVLLVVVLAGGGYWFFLRDDGGSSTPDSSTTVADDTSGDNSAASDLESETAADGGNDTSSQPTEETASETAAKLADAEAGSDDSVGTTGDDAAGKAPLPAKAPAAVAAAPKADPDAPEEPLPTLIEFDALPPALGSTAEELDEWTVLIKELYIDFGGATPRRKKKLLPQVRDLDLALSVPAYLNALRGVDISEEGNVVSVYKMVDDWQKSVGFFPRFSFPADTTRMDTKTQNLRVKVLQGWNSWWVDSRKAGQDQDLLDEYRTKALAARERLRADD